MKAPSEGAGNVGMVSLIGSALAGRTIVGGILDGPLGFDMQSPGKRRRQKNIASSVAGDADVLVVPDLESGNMLAKQLVYLAGADAAGLVLGARVPIMLTSRSDGATARMASALAQIFVHRRSAKIEQALSLF